VRDRQIFIKIHNFPFLRSECGRSMTRQRPLLSAIWEEENIFLLHQEKVL
jgi:hypothetical protein